VEVSKANNVGPVALRSVWTEVGGLRLHSRVCAEAAPAGRLPVVLVHGLSVSSRYLAPTASHLAPWRPVYAPDLPGFGQSPRPRGVPDVAALAGWLAAWMDAMGLPRAVLLGNSMGCQIIVDLAVRQPRRVAAAVLVGPTMDRHARSGVVQAWRLLRDGLGESLASIVTQAGDYARFGPVRTIRTLRLALADRIERKLPAVAAPALVVRGEHDPIAPQRWCEEVAALLPRGELQVIPRAPHALNYDFPAALSAATLAFLARHPE